MVLLSKIKEKIIRKAMLNLGLSVLLKGAVSLSLHVGLDTEVWRSLNDFWSKRVLAQTENRKSSFKVKLRETLRYNGEIWQARKLKRVGERREGTRTPMLLWCAVRQTKDTNPTKVSPAWSCGDGVWTRGGQRQGQRHTGDKRKREGVSKK